MSILSFDLAASLRRLKPEKQRGTLRRRGDGQLPFLTEPVAAGQPLLLDTTVYIDALKGRLPTEVADLMRVRQSNHSAIAIAELAHLLGRLDPSHAGTATVGKAIRRAIDEIPTHRVSEPSTQAIVDAGILTGIVARLRNLPSTQRQPLFNDAALFFQAFENGCCILSRNIADFDCVLQLVPTGRVLLYRQAAVANGNHAS